jgi:hypothetical protein
MKNLTKIRRLFFSVVLTALGVLLVFGALQTNASAANESAFYNGTVTNLDPNDNSSRTANGLIHEIWMTAKNKSGQTESSNYGTAQPGVTHNFVIKNGNYTDLHLHLKITNPSAETVNLSQENAEWLVLPNNSNFFLDNANDQVTYAGGGPVIPDPTSVKFKYSFDNRGDSADGSDVSAEEWSHLSAVQIGDGNSIAAGKSIQLDLPLNVTPDANGNTKGFTFANMSYHSWAYKAIQNWARVGSPIEPNYRQPGYEGYFVAGTGSRDVADHDPLSFANGAQKYLPKIADSLGAIGYDNTNSFIDSAPDDPDNVLYSGGFHVIHLDKIPSVTGKGTLADDLHNNGYSFLIAPKDDIYGHKANQEAKAYVYAFNNDIPAANVKMPDGSFATGQKYDGKLLGGLYLQVQQLLDASDKTIPVTKDGAWAPYDGVTFYGADQSKLDKTPDGVEGSSYVVKKVDSNNNESDVANNKVDTTKDGVYRVTYTYKVADTDVTVHKTITITVGKGNPTPPTTGISNNGGTNTSNTNNNNNNSNNGNNSGNTNGSTTTTTKPSTSVGPNIAVKGEAVYAIKKIGLYKSTSFTKSKRIAWYPKQKRINRPMFVVTGYKRTSNGTLRYKVRDVNHGRKTAGKKGYITASRKYVVPVYYASVPKSKKITVIAKKGVNAYKSANLTGKAKHYKKGVRLTVKKLVKHNLTTRYQLSNGKYVTANKKLIIAGNY